MSDYIKKEEATSIPVISKEHRKHFHSLDDAYETGWNEALACVNMIPSANVAEVVRCKDCKCCEEQTNKAVTEMAMNCGIKGSDEYEREIINARRGEE